MKAIFLLFFFSLLLMFRQFITQGYFSVHIGDTFAYTSWAWQFIEVLKDGIIYPRWMHLDFWGYGSPTFILYSPLSFYLVALYNVFTGSIILSMNIAQFTALFFSSIGIFFLAKEFYPEKTALLASIFYIFLPFNMVQMYVLGNFASNISLLWFSPVLLFTFKYFKNNQYRYLLYAGACYGGLILTHLINAYMFALVIAAYIIYMSVVMKRLRDVIALPFIITIGFLLSAAYLLPLLYEKQFINIKSFSTMKWVFNDFFLLPNKTGKLVNLAWTVYYNIYVLNTLFFFIILLFFFLQTIKLRHIKPLSNLNTINKFFIGVALGSMFFLFGPSTFLWDGIPFFRYIQFPVRWLNITAFAIGFLSASCFYVMNTFYSAKMKRYYVIVLLFMICILLDYKYISTPSIFTRQELIPVQDVYWTYEHLPVWVDIKKVDKNNFREKAVIIRGEGKAEVTKWKPCDRIVEIVAKQTLTIRLRTFNFPGWKAYIDGMQTEIKTEEGTGAMIINIPQKEHILELRFEDTPIRYYSKIISLVSFCALCFFALFFKNKST